MAAQSEEGPPAAAPAGRRAATSGSATGARPVAWPGWGFRFSGAPWGADGRAGAARSQRRCEPQREHGAGAGWAGGQSRNGRCA
jgi:hypothetical protein